MTEIIVGPDFDGERLDRFLRRNHPGTLPSRAALAELLAAGSIRVNGRSAKKGLLLRAGDRVSADLPISARPSADAELTLDVVYEDEWLVAVNKPAGIPSHALRAGETGTVTSALLARYPEMAGVGHRALEPGVLHRLDTDTSGLLLAARDPRTFELLQQSHARGELDKRYLALCQGQPRAPQLARAHLRADQRRVRVQLEAFERSKPITTELMTAAKHGELALVEVRVAFAARHQVRAHLAALGHPIAGDTVYGGPSLPGLCRHFLHASRIELSHPITQRTLQLTAAVPSDLQRVLERVQPRS